MPHATTISSSLSDADVAQLSISLEDKSNVLEEVLTELSVYTGMLYHLIEIFKRHDDFAEELSMYCLLLRNTSSSSV